MKLSTRKLGRESARTFTTIAKLDYAIQVKNKNDLTRSPQNNIFCKI